MVSSSATISHRRSRSHLNNDGIVWTSSGFCGLEMIATVGINISSDQICRIAEILCCLQIRELVSPPLPPTWLPSSSPWLEPSQQQIAAPFHCAQFLPLLPTRGQPRIVALPEP